MSLSINFLYVGFDFAFTDNRWNLIEGNLRQLVGQQIATQKGVKKEFDDFLGINYWKR